MRRIRPPGGKPVSKPAINTRQYAPRVLPHIADKEVKFCDLDEYPITPEKCCATCLCLSPVMQGIQLYGGHHAQKTGWQCTNATSQYYSKVILNKDEAACKGWMMWVP